MKDLSSNMSNQPATLVFVFPIKNLSASKFMESLFQSTYISFYLNSKIHHSFVPLRFTLALHAFYLQMMVQNYYLLFPFQYILNSQDEMQIAAQTFLF